jgi:potassium efflux system protein
LDRGGSYAMTTLAQYVIILIGGLTAFGAMGMTWSKLQWFAAAISLGIGFGLQEIVSNFVSGLIVLFERPIRPGDVVTVGDISGTVSKIKIRATTITDWDRKELIVPNREFVTGRLINWTLTDPVTRVVFKIGAAYGTDPEKVRDVLLEIAQKTPNVLADPAPSVVFQQFGDSSLDFNLRVFVPHIDYLISTRNNIQYAIDKAFKKEGIQIPFPQRDLHIKSMPPEFFKRDSAEASRNGEKSGPELGDLEI